MKAITGGVKILNRDDVAKRFIAVKKAMIV